MFDLSVSPFLYFIPISTDHNFYRLFEFCLRFPTQFFPGFGSIADQEVHFGWTIIFWIHFYTRFACLFFNRDLFFTFTRPFQFHIQFFKSQLYKFSDAVGLAGGKYKIIRCILL